MSIQPDIKVIVETDCPIATINPNIYGHFAEHLGYCIYGGIWVGENSSIKNNRGIRSDVVEALKKIKPSVVRWPGGCFADDYHWRDGIGPGESRPRRINLHWGKVIEDNSFGTHEFIEFCRQIGAEPYICGNVGSGTVREMKDWLEYMNSLKDSTLAQERAANGSLQPFNVKYFGIGNENWGCGGNMSAEYYANEVKRYSTFLHPFGEKPLYKIACGPCGDDANWTRRFFEALEGHLGLIQGFAAHYYCGTSGTATEYTDTQWYDLLHKALKMESLLLKHRAIMDEFDPERKISLIVDEWGTWHPVIPGTHPRFFHQQNSLRDALVAALTLDIFNRHADKIAMANIAQLVNVLQAMILTKDKNFLLTPTYHVYEMYAVHQGAQSVRCNINTDEIHFNIEDETRLLPRVAGSASMKNDLLNLSLVNTHTREPIAVELDIRGCLSVQVKEYRVLTADDIHAHNTFNEPERVQPVSKSPTEIVEENLIVTLPAASVNLITCKIKVKDTK
ncbi:MAG: alpha-N-arabinofuranosidase [bacterium (Candidatus Ratteibacteria) CG_4_9_14_3_um_filter_41_21]|uniref:non-reducing end alpha-L-arabinofuranosidase n=1 Tax=bacterium (Candidatus Ratteibacteria) CG_4_9_14_3_um_filter_41_21 TaxID=2014289 RepID=A0A2M7YGB2_9BACT|nr:MAG: alpha-N-arabinofuranosidase [bacterium (Candidatus Ratteibacteria) CG_4_9_14_3_um_filter_41_21]HCG77519.1 alpha-N-arabinofuranosidase [bacterium]